jgi:predicted enzyme related to lactoylglutathione lyase
MSQDASDPLGVLHTEDQPVKPDPDFAARLRRRLESALSLPEGVIMSGTANEISELTESAIRHGDIGYVSVWAPDADRAAAFYTKVLGWTYDRASHRVTNVEEPTGISAASGRPTLFCCYAVTDVRATRAAIAEAGGVPGEIRETDYGVLLDATDPQGMAFAVYEPVVARKRPEINGTGPGALSYVTYEVADSAGFRDFYARVLGWAFEPGRISDGWQLVGPHPMSGAAGGSEHPAVVPMWTVGDIDAAVARVRDAGGTVLAEPARQPYGISAECTDDQGTRFYLGQF